MSWSPRGVLTAGFHPCIALRDQLLGDDDACDHCTPNACQSVRCSMVRVCNHATNIASLYT